MIKFSEMRGITPRVIIDTFELAVMQSFRIEVKGEVMEAILLSSPDEKLVILAILDEEIELIKLTGSYENEGVLIGRIL